VAEADVATVVVDRAVGQVLDLAGGGAVEECEQADECLVGVDSRVGGPAVEQLSLPIAGQRGAAEPPGLGRGQAVGRIDQDEPAADGEAKKLSQPGQVGSACG
jgi:hypothetical protein